jgi:hypothetical protein
MRSGLLAYVDEHGSAWPPQSYVDSTGFALGRWVTVRRRSGTTGKLDDAK